MTHKRGRCAPRRIFWENFPPQANLMGTGRVIKDTATATALESAMKAISPAEARQLEKEFHEQKVQDGLKILVEDINKELAKGIRSYMVYGCDKSLDYCAITDKDGASQLENLYEEAGWEIRMVRSGKKDILLRFIEKDQV